MKMNMHSNKILLALLQELERQRSFSTRTEIVEEALDYFCEQPPTPDALKQLYRKKIPAEPDENAPKYFTFLLNQKTEENYQQAYQTISETFNTTRITTPFILRMVLTVFLESFEQEEQKSQSAQEETLTMILHKLEVIESKIDTIELYLKRSE